MRVSLSRDFGLPQEIITQIHQNSENFSQHLKSAEHKILRNKIDFEFSAITEIGRRLTKTMSLSDLKEFKSRIAEFLKMCIDFGFKYEEERLPSRYGKSKLLSIVKTINQKLINLAKELVSENRDSLKVMALVDEIRGLLLDLYA